MEREPKKEWLLIHNSCHFKAVKQLFCVILWQWLQVMMYLSKPIECTTPRVNPNANYGLQFIVMYQYWPIHYNKRTTLMQDVNNRGIWGREGYVAPLYTFCSIVSENLIHFLKNLLVKKKWGTSLVGQRLRIRLPMQGTWVQSLVWELRSHVPRGN